LKYLIFFNIGVLTSNMLLKGNFLETISKFKILIISILVFLVIEYGYVYQTFQPSPYSFIAALTGVLLIISISYKLHTCNYFSKLLNRLGTYSFEIYILHILITAGIRILLNSFFGIHNAVIHIIFGTIFGVFIPFTIAYLFRNKKWFNILFRLGTGMEKRL
jgi:peptidoglycan/LPS O-acetylase OafA/YrhL